MEDGMISEEEDPCDTKLEQIQKLENPSYHSEMAEKINGWIDAEGYIQSGLTIKKLADMLQTNRTYLSEYIKTTYGASFRDWITGLRINYAKRLLAQYFGVADVVLTSSGRNSLFLLLSYLHHKKVIVPSYTCKAVTEAALMAGKQVVYVEVSLEDFNILPEKLVHLVDDDSIVIATHQYGNPCRIEEICDICRKAGALVIEDCAASLGTVYNGKLTGLFGNYAFFSFVDLNWANWKTTISKWNTDFVPCIFPSYNDRINSTSSYKYTFGQDGETTDYINFCNVAKRNIGSKNIVLVNSWNNYQKGTNLEPTEENKSEFLKITRNQFKK